MRSLLGEPILFNRRYQYRASPLRTSVRINLPLSIWIHLNYELRVVNGTCHRLIVVRTFASLFYENHVCKLQDIVQKVFISVMQYAGWNYLLITAMNDEDDPRHYTSYITIIIIIIIIIIITRQLFVYCVHQSIGKSSYFVNTITKIKSRI